MTTTEKDWTPRYVCYANAHGKSPDEMLALDRERSPGGCMAEFMIWNSAMLSEWKKLNGMQRDFPMSDQHHAEYDAWLESHAAIAKATT